jgi:hypothetical protein
MTQKQIAPNTMIIRTPIRAEIMDIPFAFGPHSARHFLLRLIERDLHEIQAVPW